MIIKRTFSLLLFGLFTLTLSAQSESDKCKIFREGKFKLVSTVSGKNYYVTRTKKFQTEQEEGQDEQYVFKIKWIDDCTYTLVPYKVPAAFKKSWGKNVLVIEIREVDGNTYTAYAKFKKGTDKEQITHLEKIN